MPRRTLLNRYQHILGLHIRRCAIPRVAKEFLWEALERTLETATQQEQAGIAPLSLWCAFEQEKWGEALHLGGATLQWTRMLLETAGIVRFDPDSLTPSNGTLRWNLTFDEWQPLQPGAASEASAPEKGSKSDRSDGSTAADSVEDVLPAPSACLAQRWKGRPPRQVWWALRRAVLERDDWCCQYCGTRSGFLACDHVVPVRRGGASVLANLVTACTTCNSAKGNRTLTEWVAALALAPQQRRA